MHVRALFHLFTGERSQEPALFGGPPNGYGIGDQIARLALLPCAGVI